MSDRVESGVGGEGGSSRRLGHKPAFRTGVGIPALDSTDYALAGGGVGESPASILLTPSRGVDGGEQ